MNPGSNPNLLRPAGPVDPQISFICVKSTDGRPIALLANYSLHYVGGVGANTISADYFAVFADRIQQLRDWPGTIGCLWACASASWSWPCASPHPNRLPGPKTCWPIPNCPTNCRTSAPMRNASCSNKRHRPRSG
jgi:hypothetical protein